MKPITHPVALNVIYELIERIPIHQKGTYNKMDPTHFEKGELVTPAYRIKLHDCTWGVELTFYSGTNPLHRGHKELAGIYLSRGFAGSEDELIPRDGWNNSWFKTIKEINSKIPPIPQPVHHMDEEDYHHSAKYYE